MILRLKKEIDKIKKMLVDNTDECFCVSLENDDAGSHYTLYLVKDSISSILVNQKIKDLNLSKHHVIIFFEEERVHIKRKENEQN